MIVYSPEDYSQFYYLSSLPTLEAASFEADKIRKARFIPSEWQDWYNWYLGYYDQYDRFPDWQTFTAYANTIDVGGMAESYDVKSCEAIYHRRMVVWESNWYASQLPDMTVSERRDAVAKMNNILADSVSTESLNISSLSTFSLDNFVIKEDQKQEIFKMPIKAMNDSFGALIKPGHVITIVASPGMGKSSFALNILFLNSVTAPKRSLYIYLENVELAYQANLMARFSYEIGDPINNKSLKSGVFEDDVNALNKIKSVREKFIAEKQGEVFFLPFSKFNNEPSKFAAQLAKVINDLQIDIVCFDHINKASDFTPPKWTSMDYMNRIFGILQSAALGQLNNRPVVMVVCAQQNREAEQRTLKTRGKMTRFDVASVGKAEQDSFIMIGLYADEEMKLAKSCSTMVLKNRDSDGDVAPQQTTFIPEYCYIGDLSSSVDSDVYSMDTLNDVFDVDVDNF